MYILSIFNINQIIYFFRLSGNIPIIATINIADHNGTNIHKRRFGKISSITFQPYLSVYFFISN
jgi:hypothetical protein